jgi:uroporphyrinogen decarboxylase
VRIALRPYRWPDPDDERIWSPIYEQAGGWDREQTFLFGSHRDTVWEKAYMLVGMEDLMCYFHTEPEAVRELFHRIMDFQLGIARHYVACRVEMVGMTDDLGTQRGLLLSPDTITEFLVPEYRRLIAVHKERGVLASFHSCGHIAPILAVFMDLGVDILNPVQASANDLDEVRRRTQGRMALQGGVSSGLIAAGPVSAIRETAIDLMWRLGRDGGYFCAADQGMPWPKEHYRALEETVAEYGRYPLVPPDWTAHPANVERVQGP